MNELQIFNSEEFGQVRTVVIDNEPYFVGKDVAAALGYVNARDALSKHVDEDDKEVAKCDTPGGKQDLTVINESGLYALVFGSKLNSAKKFKRWVTSEVLPSLRKTGSYETSKKSPIQLLELEFEAIKEVDAKVDAVNDDLQQFKMDMPILGIEIDKITAAARKRGVNVLGGKESNAYADRSIRSKVYSDIYRELKRQFGVTTYKAIRRNQCELAVEIIEGYEPPLILAEQIEDCNSQMDLGVA